MHMRESLPEKGEKVTYVHISGCVCCRYEKLAEQEEMNSQQQRRRLFAELEQEREKMAAQWNLQRQQLEHQQVETQVCASLLIGTSNFMLIV